MEMLVALATIHLFAAEFKTTFPSKDVYIQVAHVDIMTQDAKGFTRPAYGVCSLGDDYITIDIEFAKQATHQQLKKVVFHELGHCALRLPDDNVTPSIMDKTLATANLPWDYLVGELRYKIANNSGL